jgi:hypothetical protein
MAAQHRLTLGAGCLTFGACIKGRFMRRQSSISMFRRSTGPLAVVEVFGRPGSGKSPLCERAGSPEPMTSPPMWPLRAPLFALAVALFAVSRRASLRRAGIVVRRYTELGSIKGAAVVDEGPMHALHSMLYGSNRPLGWVGTLLVRMIARQSDKLLFLEVPADTCLRRLTKRDRPHSRFNAQITDAQKAAFLADRTNERIAEAAGDDVVRSDFDGALRFLGVPLEQEQRVVT